MVGEPRKFDFADGPVEPVREFPVKTLIEFLRGKNFLPGVIQLREGADRARFLAQMVQRKAFE